MANDPNVLRLTGDRRLRDADVLSEYGAILVDPRFAPLFGYSDGLAPGQRAYTDYGMTVAEPASELEKRSQELPRFFDLGGILVVYGYEETIIANRHVPMYADTTDTTASTHSWFAEQLSPPPRFLLPGERPPFPSNEPPEPWLNAGHGTQINVVEPGHAFARYLEATTAYEARFASSVRDWSNAVVLAENRAREPVAVEFVVGQGSAIVVPPPKDSTQLGLIDEAIRRLYRERVGAGREWRLRDDIALDAAANELATRHRAEREALRRKGDEWMAAKAKALAQTHVKRATAYWDKITASGTTRERSLQDLYRLIEMLEDLYGGERGLPPALGVDKARLKAVKRLANQEEFDIRHANAAEKEDLPLTSFDDAIAFGRELVQAFVERRTREASITPEQGQPA